LDLEPAVLRAEAAILEIVRELVPNARLSRIGPTDFGVPSWSCWVITPTDRERNRIQGDKGPLARLDLAAAKAGFAPAVFVVESEETVDRDYQGSWFYAMR